jgi:hypothetical protein
MPMFPAFHTAMDDDALRGAAVHVYLYLSKCLDFVTYREIKLAVVASEAKVKERTAGWALDALVARGYIERGPKAARLSTYRLVWSIARETHRDAHGDAPSAAYSDAPGHKPYTLPSAPLPAKTA